MKERISEAEGMDDVMDKMKQINKDMKAVEEALYQTKNRSRQDPLNFPIKLNNKLAHVGALNSRGDFKPTEQSKEFFQEVSGNINEQLDKWKNIREKDIPELNNMVKQKSVDAINIKRKNEADQG